MGDEPFTTRRGNSAETSSKPSINQRLAYASQRAEVLFGCYRRGDANDPERYVAAIAAVLSDYDFEIIKEVTDPRTGICTAEKYMSFMPNAGELKVYCEGIAARRERIQRLGSRRPALGPEHHLAAPEALPGDLATIFVPVGHPRYSALIEWARTADPRFWKHGRSSDNGAGIWVSYDIWDKRQIFSVKSLAAASAPVIQQARVRAEYQEAGVPMPDTPLALGISARRAMKLVDAERLGRTETDRRNREAAE
jgi:hypothetical protein